MNRMFFRYKKHHHQELEDRRLHNLVEREQENSHDPGDDYGAGNERECGIDITWLTAVCTRPLVSLLILTISGDPESLRKIMV